MNALTQSYGISYGGKLLLSGESHGIAGPGKAAVAELNGGKAAVYFKRTDDAAIRMVEEAFGAVRKPDPEEFIIHAGEEVTVYADTERAALYAAYAIRARYDKGLEKGLYYSYPAVPHRSVRVFLPPKAELDYFKRFVDLLVQLGYNAILLEIGGAMEYKRHPEINTTWAAYCKSMQEFNGKTYRASSCYCRTKNSIHTYNANGDIYSQQELRELAAYCRERCIEIIPEVPSLTHSEYILLSHPELRECQDEPFASTACPSDSRLYDLVFDLYDEVIDVFAPSTLHIGHDEWWVMGVCEKCRDQNPAELYAEDVRKSYQYLKDRGIRTMMWADKVFRAWEKTGEPQCGSEKHIYSVKNGKTLNVLGEEVPLYTRYWFQAPAEAVEKGFHQVIPDTADCIDMLPKDILFVNWCWSVEPRILDAFLTRGLDMVYGNCNPAELNNYKDRFALGAKGFSVSDWVETTELGLQSYETLFGLAYGAAICWGHARQEQDYEENLFDAMGELYRFRNRQILEQPHLEVEHTLKTAWAEGDKYCTAPYYDREKLTIGTYEIIYADGRVQQHPILYRSNIGTFDAKVSRWDSRRLWHYVTDQHLTMTASVCDPVKADGGIRYRAVFPVEKDAVFCRVVPKPGFEALLEVTRMVLRHE